MKHVLLMPSLLVSLSVLFIISCSSTSGKKDRLAETSDSPELGSPELDSSYRSTTPGLIDNGTDGSETSEKENQRRTSKGTGTASDSKQDHTNSSLYSQLHGAVVSHNFEKTQEISAKLLAQNPNDIKALNALGIGYLKNKKLSMARLLFRRALDSDSKNAGIINNYGLTFLAEAELLRARQEFTRALEVDSKNAAAAGNLGTLHLRARNYLEAKKWLEIAYFGNRSNISVANNFGLSLKGSGDFAAAGRVYEELSASTKDTGVLLNYATLLVEKLADKTKGQEVINKIKFLATDPAILDRVRQLEAKIK